MTNKKFCGVQGRFFKRAPGRRRQEKVFFIVLLLLLAIVLPGKYHPEIKWREIKDSKFHVVFPVGYEEEAGYTLAAAQRFYKKLQDLWGMEVRGKIKILLTDVYDESNGSATFFPFNQIQVYLFNPLPDSTLGSCRQWIDLVLSHEMTHIFNLNAGSGFSNFMRKVFGSNPFFYPMIYAPVWVQEGVPVYVESQLDAGGRLNVPDYSIMLDRVASAGAIPRPSHLYGEPTEWPGPTAKYFYGAAFMQFLAKKYGEEKMTAFIKHYGRHPIPLLFDGGTRAFPLTVSQHFNHVYKKRLPTLWNEFIESIPVAQDTSSNKLHVLTSSGFDKKYPVYGGKDKIFYVNRNYKEYPGIYRLDLKSGETRRWIKRAGINGLSFDSAGGTLYFSAADFFKTYYWFSDIYRLDIKTRRVKRLTRGRRLFHPVTAGDHLYCIKRGRSCSRLARLDLESGREKVISPAFSAMAYPAVSPDGSRIAVSIKRNNENWQIGIFDTEGKLIRLVSPVSPGEAKCYYPVWKNSSELYFITEYKGNYRPAYIDLETGTAAVYHDPQLPAVRYFTLLPNFREAVVSFFDANGFNLARVNLPDLELERISPEENRDHGEQAGRFSNTVKPAAVGKYRFLRDLLPGYFTPGFRSAGNEYQPGVFLSGADLLSKHYFELDGYYGPKTRTFNWRFSYTYDGLYPTLTFRYRDYTSLHRTANQVEYTNREREIEFIGMYPLAYKNRYQFWWYSNIYFEKTLNEVLDTGETNSLNLNGIKVGIFFNSARTYYDSLSPADGFRVALTYSRDLEFLGSDYEINTAVLEYKHYLTLFRPNVLGLRFTVMDSWGKAKRVFYMGGNTSYTGYGTAGDNLFELMRGYPAGYFSGTGGYLLNLEYRLSLFKIERAFLISRSLERVYLNVFADIGNLWQEEKKIDPGFSLGMELNLSLLFGEFRFILSGGAAVGQHPYHEPIFYFRIGNSF